GRKPFLLIGLTLYPLIYGLMWIFDDYPWIIFAIYSVPLYAIKVPTANAIMSDLTSEKERARGMSLITLEQTITMNSGVILFCYVADIAQQGIRIIPLFPVTFGIVAIIIALFFIKETNQKHLSFQKLKRETKTTAIEGLEHSD
ncbi:MAG: MFS transporter, partial [Asgard group archaeon]|nr:MFS transporter [Asgard group archaeon]